MNKQKFKCHQWHFFFSRVGKENAEHEIEAICRRRQCRLMFAYLFLSPSAAHPCRKRKQTSFECLTIFTAAVFIFWMDYPFNHIVSGRTGGRRGASFIIRFLLIQTMSQSSRGSFGARDERALLTCVRCLSLCGSSILWWGVKCVLFLSNSSLSARRSPTLQSGLPFRICLP